MKKLLWVLFSLSFALLLFFACDDPTPDGGDGGDSGDGGEIVEQGDSYLPTYGDNIVDYDALM